MAAFTSNPAPFGTVPYTVRHRAVPCRTVHICSALDRVAERGPRPLYAAGQILGLHVYSFHFTLMGGVACRVWFISPLDDPNENSVTYTYTHTPLPRARI